MAFVWGGGKWFASRGAASSIVPRDRVERRGLRIGVKGTAYAREPPKEIWPDLVTIDGTDYEEEGVGSLVYRSAEVGILNLTALRR